MAQLFSLGIMSAFFKKAFLEEPRLRSAGWRYGFLAVVLALLIAHVFIPTRHYYSGFIIPLMLLFNHLAFSFRWSPPVTIALRACAYFWIIFGSVVIVYQIFTSQ